MRLAIIAAAVLAASAANADLIYRNGEDWVRVTQAVCSNEGVRGQIEALGLDPDSYLQATARIGGENFKPCYTPIPRIKKIYMLYDDGDAGLIPANFFKEVPEV